MKPFALLTAFAFAAVALAGCASGGGDDGGLSGLDQCADGACEEGATIAGHVLDDVSLPLAGANVGIVETGNQTTADESGVFVFTGLAPGTYTLSAVALGYESDAQRVTLEEDERREITFNLDPLPTAEPYADVIGPEAGHFHCMVGTPVRITSCNVQDVMGEDKQSVTFELSSPEQWQTIVGEMRWTQGTAATSTGLANYISYEGRDTSHWWCEADGESPIVFQYEREGDSICTSQGDTDPEPHDTDEVETLIIAADSGFGGLSAENPPLRLVLDQRYELMVSVFYVEPAPEGYSALPDQ